MAEFPEVVAVYEIAEMLGVGRPRVHQIINTPSLEFPEPVARLRAGSIWLKADIEHWMEHRPRPKGGRKKKET